MGSETNKALEDVKKAIEAYTETVRSLGGSEETIATVKAVGESVLQAYTQSAASKRDDGWQARLLGEYDQIGERYKKLYIFVDSFGFAKLSERERELLLQQLVILSEYKDLLAERVKLYYMEGRHE